MANENIFDVDKKFVDLSGLQYFWGKAKSYIDAADADIAGDLAELAEAVAALKGDGEGSVTEQITALETAIRNDMATEQAARIAAEEKVAKDAADALKAEQDDRAADEAALEAALKTYAEGEADAAEAAAKAYTDEKLGSWTNGETPATGLRAEIEAKENALSEAIADVEAAAKSYSIVAVTEGLGANVKEAFKLVDEDGTQAGAQINIYKDSALQSVVLEGQELVFTYLLANGTEDVVRVDVSSFLAESEFKDGLQVVDHVVSVKVDAASESFLTVGADGIKLSGVQDAIDSAANGVSADLSAELAELEAKLYGTEGENATEGDLAKMKAALEKYADDAVDAEAALRVEEDGKLSEAIAALTKTVGDNKTACEEAIAAEAKTRGEEDTRLAGLISDLETTLKTYADQAEADALSAAQTYTDELFNSIQFVQNSDIDGFNWSARA